MGVNSSSKKAISTKAKGFTLLELIVVLAGLGILSSLAIPNFIALLDSNKVDEIKALLNSAAADCLQKSRSESDPIINDEIISDGIIENIGYKVDQTRSLFDSAGKPKCSTLWLAPTNGDVNESTRYNIGFSLSDGILDKLGSTEVAEKKPDCIKWAGKCEFSEAAKILAEHKQKVKDAESACSQQFTDWKENKKMNPSKFKIWDSSKGPDTCPKSPPEGAGDAYNPETNTCTTTGCDPGIPVWGLWDKDKDKGTVYYSKTDYEEARDELVGEQCAKQIKDDYENAKPPFTNPSSEGVQPSKCNQDYWFVDGEITGPAPNGSKEKWKEAMCEKNKQALLTTTHSGPVKYCETSPIYICAGAEILKDGSREEAKAKFDTCLDNSNQDKCTSALNADAIQRGDGGPYTSPTPQGMNAPIGDDCNVQYWYCKDKIYREQEKYDADTRCEAKQCILKDEFQCLMTGSYYWCCEGP